MRRQHGGIFLWQFVAYFLLAALAVSAARAQEGDATDKPATPPLREKTVYVPYEKLREVFEKPGRGVFLSYEEFQQLWAAARSAKQAVVEEKAPTPVVLTDSESEATVEKDIVRVRVKLKIDVLRAGWHEVPLRLADSAILSATVDGRPATITVDAQGNHTLLLHSESKQPVELRAELEYARAYSKADGRNRVMFSAPQAAVSRWKIRIPQPGVDVEVRPLVAATVEPSPAAATPAAETVLMAFVGAASQVDIQWTPKAEGASGLAAVVTAQAEQEVNLETGAMRTRARLNLGISRADLAKVTLNVPVGQKIVNVFDANVRKWSVSAAAGGQQHVAIELFEPRRGTQPLIIDLERFTGEQVGEVSVPQIAVADAGRQQGTVVVRVAPGLRAEAIRSSGLSQLDTADLSPELARQHWDFAYRYAALPFDLGYRVEKIQPKIFVNELVEAMVEPERLGLRLTAVLDVTQAGVFQIQADVPPGFDVRDVRGVAIGGAAATVDSHHLSGPNNGKLLINLANRAEGKVGVVVELSRRLDDANLAGPTGEKSTIPLVLPRISPESVEQVRGRVVIYSPESLQVNPGKVTAVTSTSVDEARSVIQPISNSVDSATRPVLAYAYSKQPITLSLVAERRRPQVTIAQLLVVRAKPGVVTYEATFNYEVRYSSVKSLRIDVPADLATQIRNVTPGVREQAIEPAPKDVADKYVAWSLTGQTEWLGNGAIRFTWEKKLDKLDVGKSVTLDVPRLVPRNVDRAWGQIVLVKDESLDVTPTGEPQGLRPIDPQQELMPQARVPDAASAYEFHDDWKLSVAATSYQPEELKWTSIEKGVVRMVCTRANKISVQALFRLRSAGQRLKIVLPASAAFDTDPVRINGRTTSLERGDAGSHFIPLSGQTPEKPLVLELRYVTSGTPSQLDLPNFPDDPAVQKVALCVYVPHEQALLGSHGPWTPASTSADPFGMWSYGGGNDVALINELTSEVPMAGNPADTFPTDGRLYIYSTIGPAAPPQGSLRLVTFDEKWLNGIVFALVIVGGLLLVRRRPSTQFAGLVGFFVAALLAGVFLPLFASRLLNGYIALAVLMVLLIWLAGMAARSVARQPKTVAVTPRPPTPIPTPAPVESPPPPNQEDATGGPTNA